MSKLRSRRSSARRERLALSQLMTRDGVLDAKRLVYIGKLCCDALAPHHARWQWRRDLSPSSLAASLSGSSIVRIELVDRDVPRNEPFPAGASYLAPERACGLADDARSDLYALGCILFELSAGRPPFVAPTLTDLVLAHVMVAPPAADHLPPAVAAIVEQLMAKEPSERYQTVSELRTALDAAGRALETIHDRRSAA